MEHPIASTSTLPLPLPTPLPPPTTYTALGVDPFLTKALHVMSIRIPTTVQQACIPPILAGGDCIGSAQTGSGKTIAFAIPILQALSKDPYGFFALVLTPTRELAFQISEQFRVLGASLSLSSTVIVGGMDMMVQSLDLKKKPHIIIATPGRLVDLIKSNIGEFNFSRMKFLVLDEADRLLTPTFAPELSFLIDQLPPAAARQTLLFTATITPSVLALQNQPQSPNKPKTFVHLSTDVITTPSSLTQKYIFCPSQVREIYLVYLLRHLCSLLSLPSIPLPSKPLLRKHEQQRHSRKTIRKSDEDADEAEEGLPQTILFVPTCRLAGLLVRLLGALERPVKCTGLHSGMSQGERLGSLSLFRRQQVPLLIATDVASRGLDIPLVAVIINWDVPRIAEDYIHRVGRTARAGKKGTSVTIVTEGDVALVEGLEKRINTTLTELVLPEKEVLEKMNEVLMAKRMGNMALHNEGFGERKKNNEMKLGGKGKTESGLKKNGKKVGGGRKEKLG